MAKGKQPIYGSKKSGLTQSQKTVVKELAKGQLQVGVGSLTGQTYTNNVEVTPWYVSATAGGGDVFYAYIRLKYCGASLAGGAKWLAWYLARWKIADGVPDLSTADTREIFQKDRRILKRGSFLQGGYTSGSGVKTISVALRNLRIPDGERVGLVVVNHSATAADFVEIIEYEQREISIS